MLFHHRHTTIKMLFFLFVVTSFTTNSIAQELNSSPNIIIISTDGLRWQEVFKGVDTFVIRHLLRKKDDSTAIYQKYGASTQEESRAKLMPFLWKTIAEKGQLYGNRQFDNKVNVANPYQFSYPGYSELFCGKVDTKINSNDYPSNPNQNILDFFNEYPLYQNQMAVFAAWRVFDSIFHSDRASYPVYAAFKKIGGNKPSEKETMINILNAQTLKFFNDDECLDVYTHHAAMEYLKTRKPKIIVIGYGETDEWAHEGLYKFYLEAAHRVDQNIKDIWSFIEQDSSYKDNTILLLTTDHGRGNNSQSSQWTAHGEKVQGSGEMWFAIMGKNIPAKGEIKTPMQTYLKQLVPTIMKRLQMKNIPSALLKEKMVPID